MDRSISLQRNEMTENGERADANNCRFRHGLNMHCQISVLQYLSANDLLQLSKLETYWKQLILNWVIGNTIVNVDVTDLSDKREMLEVFGKSIRKIRATGRDYKLILDTISNYCSPNIVTDIQIISQQESTKIMSFPSFPNLQRIRIDSKLFQNCQHEIAHLNKIAARATASNLQVLKVRGRRIHGNWLRAKHLKNLSELWMHSSEGVSLEDITHFIREHPKLKTFSFTGTGANNLVAIGHCLSEHCKTLKTFRFEDIAGIGKDYQSKSESNYSDALKSYGFLSTFPSLNNVTITTYKYLHHPLMSLSAIRNVKDLTIRVCYTKYLHQCKIKFSLDLQSMEVYIYKEWKGVHGKPCQSMVEQIVDIVSTMKNVEIITLEGYMSDLHRILELTPNLRTLSISEVCFIYYPVEIRKIARMLRKIGVERGQRSLLHLIVDEMQMRELSVYEKENIMTASVDPQFIGKGGVKKTLAKF